MDSHLASVLTRSSSKVQDGSLPAEPEERSSTSTAAAAASSPGSPRPRASEMTPAAWRDAPSISGNEPEVGGTFEMRSQAASAIGVPGQPAAAQCSQPIRLGVAPPPWCERSIIDSVAAAADGPTKDPPGDVRPQKAEDVKSKPEIQEVEAETEEGKDNLSLKIQTNDSEKIFTSLPNTVGTPSQQLVPIERNTEDAAPQSEPCKVFSTVKEEEEEQAEEQTEPLDLSLPRRRQSRDRKCSRFLDDSGSESLLIMEVDEYEGEGDQDVVEDDDDDDNDDHHRWDAETPSMDTLEGSAPLPPFSSLLLIDDQGVPYTLGPDGLKVPQVDPPETEDLLLESVGLRGQRSPGPVIPEDPEMNQNMDDKPIEPSADPDPPVVPVQRSEAAVSSTDPSGPLVSAPVQLVQADPCLTSPSISPTPTPAPPSSSGVAVSTQPIQIVARPPTNTPILLLSSSSPPSPPPPLSSTPLGLALPLSVPHTPPPISSAPVLLLLSSVPPSSSSSSGDSAAFALIDPSTGHLSQIAAAPPPLTLSQAPLPLPAVSHPIIRLSPNNPPVILPGLKSVTSSSLLTSLVSSSSSAAAPLLHCAQISSSESESKAIIPEDAEQVSAQDDKPLTSAACDRPPQPDPKAPPQTSEPPSDQRDQRNLHTQHLPLDDHLYFSSAAAPPSPPTKLCPLDPLEPLEPLEPLDPLEAQSPLASPNSVGPRRVLYCQLCPRVFFYLSDLERHAITHSQKKPHVCQQCGKAFKRSSHLQRHKHIHTGQRNFVCPICAKRFREAGELQRHQRVHTGEKPYQCQLCHTRFAERNTLRRHTKRKHPYHQVAMEMLSERGGANRGSSGGGAGAQEEEEESAEWYNSTVSNFDHSESEAES